jgi:hypothetical protein
MVLTVHFGIRSFSAGMKATKRTRWMILFPSKRLLFFKEMLSLNEIYALGDN